MAEILAIVANMMTVLDSRAAQKVVSIFSVRKELERLKTILATVEPVLRDAEEQQLNNHEIRAWLLRVKDASYEADDILDDFKIEALRQNIRILHNGRTTRKVLHFTFSLCSVVFRFKMSHRIKEVRQQFDEIAEDRHKFHLTENPTVDMRVLHEDRQQTISFVDERQVLGREEDRDKIVKLLLGIEEQQDVSVFAIQGMGGLGKTTLAQFVYNDRRVDKYFNLKMWVCVAQHFDVKDIIKKILASATDNQNLEQLQFHLREQLQGKRFLLVLDDIWNENEEKWEKLKSLLIGARGSKILITTRSLKVADFSGAISTHLLKGLSNDDCWELFKKRALARGKEEAYPNLVVIGKEIVKKCGGVPLAAKSLGSIMRLKTEEHEWASVKDSDIWTHHENDILPALRISYNDLPFDLKQCFAYCFYMKKGETISNEVLIQMWIAQGYIVHLSGDYHDLHRIGERYIQELQWRSFFDITDIRVGMHDLIHDLAREVAAGAGCFIWKQEALVPSPREVRHVTFFDSSHCIPHEYLVSLRGLSNLRTLELYSFSLVDDIFSPFRCLRVLIVTIGSGDCPSSIGKLKHLRYLCITSKDIQTLPKCVMRLHCLEVLRLDCPKLIELSSDIEKMVNLRYIYLKPYVTLSQMPFGLGKLINLRGLSLFVVGKGTGCKLSDLHGLIHLGGSLMIRNLENVSSAIESTEANLSQKHIRDLQLFWNEEDNSHGNVSRNETHVAVLETLQPHQNIEALQISGYGGAKFPCWLMESSFSKIVRIMLNRCEKCEHLPPFWKLPSLKVLVLMNMDALRSMESGAERGQQVWFPSLRELTIWGARNLDSLTPRAAAPANDSIEELNVDQVSFPSLEELRLEVCNKKLVHSLLVVGKDNPSSFSSLAKLRSLEIRDCNDLEALPEGALQRSTSLEDLTLSHCPIDLNSLPMEIFTSIEILKFKSLPKLVSLPEGIQNAAKLHKFEILKCEGLMSLQDWMGNLTSLRTFQINGCPQLKLLPDRMQQLTALENLMIYECTGLTSWPYWLGSFRSLRHIVILCTSNLPSLPEQLQNLTCLRILGIGAYNLTSLPEWMVHLTWLQELQLMDCGEHLKSRCQKDTGEDWPKISHIPAIVINNLTIQNK